ncbi:MAG: AAA domain-containing protein [Actinobacteria bacterium]|nr:AAA domain-containing protein [Actinomycetota bacterium]
MDRSAATKAATGLIENVERVIRGKRRPVEAAITCLLAGSHLLVEDVPGVGKTMLARSIARSVRGSFKRIQATPDLLPADITGASVYNQADATFEFKPGPLFADVVLMDEINRTTPRTQSALLEAMDEGAVTVEGVRHPLPDAFFLIATQNPVEHHGTYPLPEGQLDRFAMAIDMGYVDAITERQIVRAQLASHPIEELDAVLSLDEVVGVRRHVRATHVGDEVLEYAMELTRATREHPDVELGASPRASITLVRCAQSRALLDGRDFVLPDDVKSLAVSALGHRMIPAAGMRLDQGRGAEIVKEIVAKTPVPVTE